jgi:YHS domain-containing protein
MGKVFKVFALSVAALILGLGVSAAAAVGEFDGECVMGLALGKDIQTDCSVNTVYQGKTYCFGNETARTLFLKRPEDFLLQAHIYYSSKQPD